MVNETFQPALHYGEKQVLSAKQLEQIWLKHCGYDVHIREAMGVHFGRL
jgi:hypothetical protein